MALVTALSPQLILPRCFLTTPFQPSQAHLTLTRVKSWPDHQDVAAGRLPRFVSADGLAPHSRDQLA
jgi:hypothetical protein